MDYQEKTDQFIAVIDAHKGILYKIVNSYCKESSERNDLIQEIYLQLWKAFENYKTDFKYSTWIYRISLNVAISFYRKQSSRVKIALPMENNVFQFSDEADHGEKETDFALLQQFISELNEFDKAIMLLYLEEKSYKEIAEITGITETNVSTKTARIKQKLKERFKQHKNN
ncbi:MAG: sigma-70 family RNA polymerase sigma factor [Ferruginibacter sp.]